MSRLTRRRFLKGSVALTTGTLLITGTKATGNFFGANERIRIAVAGINGRGGSHISEFAAMPDVEVACLIDPDSRLFTPKSKAVKDKGGNTPACVQDIRRALDDKTLDAITIAAPNHWHALMTIWACQAGKDVYVEKPASHNIHEGRVAVQIARKYNRIVQHGTQSRGSGGWQRVAAAIASGKLGKLLVARGLCYKARGSIGTKPPTAPPAGLDFNLWLGPAPDQPHHGNLVHYNWHWFWDTGNGDIGNQGVHQMDIARWGIPGATLPKSVISIGGRFGYKDQGETPNTQIAIFDYGDTQLIFEVRGLKTEGFHGQKVGNIFHLEAGRIEGTRFFPNGSTEPHPLPDVQLASRPGGGIFQNFIAAMRTRKHSDLHADILDAHYSSALCHLANVSYRLGAPVPFNAKTKAFGDNRDAYETLARMEEHLARDNGIALDGLTYQLGKKLMIDPKAERTDDSRANQILHGSYRSPFIVPETVA